MSVARIIDLFAAITTIGLVAVLVRPGSQTAAILRAWGDTFAASMRAAMGN